MQGNADTRAELPPDWSVVFREPVEPRQADEVPLYAQGVPNMRESLALLFSSAGPSAWGRGPFPWGRTTIRLSRYPPLDEVWTLWMWAACESRRDAQAHPEWERMGYYTGLVRSGRWPDAEPLEHSVQAVYAAMRTQLLVAQRSEEEFLRATLYLCSVVAGELAAGKKPHLHDLLGTHAAFESWFEDLAGDRNRYATAAKDAPRYMARVPAEHHPGHEPREAPLLVLSDLVATQYKLWARRDPEAPGGCGYPLLLVEESPGRITLTSDPTSKLRVAWLAEPLSRAEREVRGEPAPWFDGRAEADGTDRFGGTVCAYPKDGTRLSLDRVVSTLKGPLHLARIRATPRRPMTSAAVVAAVVVLAWLAWAVLGGRGRANPPRRTATKGPPLGAQQVSDLLASDDGPGGPGFRRYALLVGAANYQGLQKLEAPPNDVLAMRRLLTEHYGYRDEDVEVLCDAGKIRASVDPPTPENLLAKLQGFERIGSSNSSFLFYYSGHGETKQGQQLDYGVLALPGYYTRTKSEDLLAFDTHGILRTIRKHVKSDHIMLVLDCCYSGWIGEVRVEDLDPAVTDPWAKPAWSALTAGRRNEKATAYKKCWYMAESGQEEVKLSALTFCLQEALHEDARGGFVPADENHDRVVTDEELARFVSPRVSRMVRNDVGWSQTPTFARLDTEEPLSAKFLFVPGARK